MNEDPAPPAKSTTTPVALAELAQEAVFSMSDLYDDDEMDAIEGLTDLEKVQLRYRNADFDDFALALHAVTGWKIVAVSSASKGPLHRLNVDGEGRLVDVMGFVNEDDLRKRYRIGRKDLVLVTQDVASDSLIDNDEELKRVASTLLHLPCAPFNDPGLAQKVESFIRHGVFLDDPGEDLLIVVHPGSVCGSADFNLGKSDARCARDGLVLELNDWSGGIVVIDGSLSDELVHHRSLDQAIEQALARARDAGHRCERVVGDDPDQVDRTRELIKRLGDRAPFTRFVVTGAWYHPEDGSGCVGSVVNTLRERGLQAQVSEFSAQMPSPWQSESEEIDPDTPQIDEDAVRRSLKSAP